MSTNNAELTDFDRMVLTEYPYPIAVGYRRVLEAKDDRTKVDRALTVFDLGIRTLALGYVQQYSLRDAPTLNSSELNSLIFKEFPRPTLGTWKNIVFAALRAYKSHRNRLFMQELHDIYWGTDDKGRQQIEQPFQKLVDLRNEIEHELKAMLRDLDWANYSAQIVPRLVEVLKQFEFLRDYDLVHITVRHGNEYSYVCYTGENPEQSLPPLSSEQELSIGWLYLVKNNTQFVPLYPLLIFYELDDDVTPALGLGFARMLLGPLQDAAIYNTYTDREIRYVAPVLGKTYVETNRAIIEELVRRLHSNIGQLIKLQQVAKRLTWSLLCEVARKVSEEEFGATRYKYHRELYLQRQYVKDAFEDFLQDDKAKAFLLLGKSGVGKSSFFLSMADEYEGNHQVALFLYNGAMPFVDQPFAEIIGEDIASFLRLEEVENAEIKDPLLLMSRIQHIEKRRVVLFIDAINENSNAKEFLRRINDLVSSSTKYPWFKVVISSRPEAWKAIKRGVPLATHLYYSRSGDQELGVEIQPFTIEAQADGTPAQSQPQPQPQVSTAREQAEVGLVVKDFTRLELPLAYEKYKKVYDLRTEYSQISSELRRILNDPLALKLVAKTYSRREIPANLQPGEIYRDYIAQLVEDGRLEDTDLAFLENDIMPLILSQAHYDNKATVNQINNATTSSGRPLREFITNVDLLPNKRHFNQSFQNIANAEILILQGGPLDYEVGFKYERFYDYFGGRRLAKLAENQSDKVSFFRDLILLTAK
jgi:hypothetical protein